MQISDILVPNKINKREKRRRRVLIGLFITGILSATLAVVTYFGFFTGTNFLILDQELGARGIHISKYSDLRERTSKILIDPIGEDGLSEIDNRDIDFNSHKTINSDNQFGEFVQEKNNVTHTYAIYQFYLINESDKLADSEYTLNVSYLVEITRSTNNLSDALGYRVFVEEYEDGIAKKEEYDSSVLLNNKKETYFKTIENFKPKEVKRITFYFWLEGDLTNDTMINGSIRLRIRLTIGEAEGEL